MAKRVLGHFRKLKHRCKLCKQKISIMSIDNKVENIKSVKEVDIANAARGALSKLKNVKDLDILHYRQESKVSLISLVDNSFVMSIEVPTDNVIKFSNPSEISTENAKEICKNMSATMEKLEESSLISAFCAQRADREFKAFIYNKTIVEICKNYFWEVILDVFWMEVLQKKKFEIIHKVITILLPVIWKCYVGEEVFNQW